MSGDSKEASNSKLSLSAESANCSTKVLDDASGGNRRVRGTGKGRERKGSARALRMGVDASLVGLRLGRREKGNSERRS